MLKKEAISAKNAFLKDPRNPYLRGKLFRVQKEYKRQAKHLKDLFKCKQLEQLESKESNQAEFWKAVKGKPSETTSPNISSEDWKMHFSNLSKIESNMSVEPPLKHTVDKLLRELQINDPNYTPHTLNRPFTCEEIVNGIKTLKKGKQAGPDVISNEMLTTAQHLIDQTLNVLFNTILSLGQYPVLWKHSFILPIYKKGDKHKPENYHGISLQSCLSKLFAHILHDRLYNFLEEK
jgi:hypothetical protein